MYRRELNKWSLVMGLGVVIGTAGLSACSPKDNATSAVEPRTVRDPLVISLTPEMDQRFLAEPVTWGDITPLQQVPGRIEANERLVTRIGASVMGRVTDVMVDVGDKITSGEALAKIASPELSQTQMAYLRASSGATLAERAVERARLLFQADVIGSAELQRRESELTMANAERRALSDQLRQMGLSSQSIDRLKDQGTLQAFAHVLATQGGVVIERKVSNGQVAQPGDPLFTVADLSNVWVVGALPEQTARAVQVGQKVEIEVPALAGRQIAGKIVYVGDTVSPETRTVPFRTQVDNPQRDLKPQMLATMRIQGESRRQLVVPQDAVVRDNDQDHVYVRIAPGQYRFTKVELGSTFENVRPVLHGLNQGDVVVKQGAFHLHQERLRAAGQ